MTNPSIHGKPKAVSASNILQELGDSLGKIKAEDGLTWIDVGRVLGKSDDQAAKYADGTAEMGVTAYYFAKKEWNGRFTGGADRLVEQSRAAMCPKSAQTQILQAAFELSIALQDDVLSMNELHAMRSTLENARDAIQSQLNRLVPQPVDAA